MEVRLADCAGFCFGVKRAVDTVYEQLKNGKTIYTYGPIVHNEEVVRELAEKGVRVLESKEELKSLKAGENIPTVIIRAHGVAKEIYDIMEANGLECIDATCPFVKKIQSIAARAEAEGRNEGEWAKLAALKEQMEADRGDGTQTERKE